MQLLSSFVGQRFVFGVAPPPPRVQPARQVTCMAKKKGTRIIVTLECTEARGEGKTPSRYTTQKARPNKRNTPERLELMKYNRFLRRHTLHKEIK